MKNDKITEFGLYSYWNCIDAAFHFNAMKHDIFVAKAFCNASQQGQQQKKEHSVKHSQKKEEKPDNRIRYGRGNESFTEEYHSHQMDRVPALTSISHMDELDLIDFIGIRMSSTCKETDLLFPVWADVNFIEFVKLFLFSFQVFINFYGLF